MKATPHSPVEEDPMNSNWNTRENAQAEPRSTALMNSPRGCLAFSALDVMRRARLLLTWLMDILRRWDKRSQAIDICSERKTSGGEKRGFAS
jgi:hypothetical protein